MYLIEKMIVYCVVTWPSYRESDLVKALKYEPHTSLLYDLTGISLRGCL